MAEVKISGGENLQKFLAKLKSTKPKSLEVGFLQSETAKIAIINEYGAEITVTGKMRKWFAAQGVYLRKDKTKIIIPPRPFMQRTVTEHATEWQAILTQLLPRFDYDAKKVLLALGAAVSGHISETIEEGEFTANAPLTIRFKKGKDKPLVDTGNMAKSVNYRVK